MSVPGALFSAGDAHAAQGDGEVNVTAIETALEARDRFTAWHSRNTRYYVASLGEAAGLPAAMLSFVSWSPLVSTWMLLKAVGAGATFSTVTGPTTHQSPVTKCPTEAG